jgi:FkbM family methyltransferase
MQVLTNGTYEFEITELLRSAARPGTLVFDVGANIGLSALPILAHYPDVRVVSVEASPNVLPYLVRTQASSPYKDRWQVVGKAATAVHGRSITFIINPPGGDVFDGLRDTNRGGGGRAVTVETTTIDHEWEMRGRPPVSLMKVDVEGAELEVFAGAAKCLRACRPVIVTEWCLKNLKAYGTDAAAILDVAAREGYIPYLIPELTQVSAPDVFRFQLALRENLLLLPEPSARAKGHRHIVDANSLPRLGPLPKPLT